MSDFRFHEKLLLKDGRRRARSHTHKLVKEEPLLVDPSRLDPAGFIEFREERAHAIGGCPEGKTTIEVLGLNRSELTEARGRRLQTLRYLALACTLLRQSVARAPTPELLAQLRTTETTLLAAREASGEYAAMARAFLDGSIPVSTGD